jgi:hypothetical protein
MISRSFEDPHESNIEKDGESTRRLLGIMKPNIRFAIRLSKTIQPLRQHMSYVRKLERQTICSLQSRRPAARFLGRKVGRLESTPINPDDKINLISSFLRNLMICCDKKMQKLSTKNKPLKILISKKDRQIQKVRKQSVRYREAWTKILAIENEQDGELQTFRQEKRDYEAEIVKLRKKISRQGQELGTPQEIQGIQGISY